MSFSDVGVYFLMLKTDNKPGKRMGRARVLVILFAQKEQEEDYMDFAMLNEKGLLNKAFRWIQNTF